MTSVATPCPVGADASPGAAVAAPSTSDLDSHRALMLQAAVLSHAGYRQSATAFATELASMLGCSRVTLGFVRRSLVELAAVSHGHGETLVGPGFDAIAAAMDESVQQGCSIHLPPTPNARSVVRLAHAKLLQRQGGAIATVPMVHAGEVVGAVTCEWMAHGQGTAGTAGTAPAQATSGLPRLESLETLVNLIGPVLNLMRLREAPLRERCGNALRRAWQAARDLHDRRVQAAVALGAVAVVALCAVPMPYRVGGHARIEGLLQRSLAAPMDGFLKAVNVRPGDHVVKGQVLAEMADQDLVLQRRKWISELAQQESAHALALAKADRAALVVALARPDQARAQLELVDADIARGNIVAPFDGIVIQGDLAQSVGSPVERGKPLLLVAPGESYRVVVEVDERDVGEVQAGQSGTLALAALPWDSLAIQVSRVTPIAHTVDGNNVFEVEARLAPGAAAQASRIRPGLEGVAKLTVDKRPLAWAVSHRVAEWLRLKVWSWWA